MNVKELIQRRLVNQRLTSIAFESCEDVVAHFGAIQSQDYAMAKWGVAIRMQKASDQDIETCINGGDIIRTHILRPTWHFVSRNDIRWMMALSAPSVKKATQYVDRQVGLTDDVFKKAWRIIELALKDETNLTKEDLMDRLALNKLKVESLMATQIIIRAEVEMRLCNGVRREKKVTYSLFDSRVPQSEKISRKDSLVKLATLYFKSRSPATIKDYMWWSGLSLADAKFGISGLGEKLRHTSCEGLTYLYFEDTHDQKKKVSVLLPPYDEYMVGYAEGRKIALLPGADKSFLGNGIFKPLVLSDNKIVGTWKKLNKEPFVQVEFLADNGVHKLNSSVKAFKRFLENRNK